MTTMFYSARGRLFRASRFGFAKSPVSAEIPGELILAARLAGSA